MENKYPKGIYYNEPHPNAPEFIHGSISINKDLFIKWLQEEEANEKGYIKLDLTKNKNKEGEDFIGFKLNTYKQN